MAANLGGTELLKPLTIALMPTAQAVAILKPRMRHCVHGTSAAVDVSTDAHATRDVDRGIPRIMGSSPRNIIIFTDGEVANTRQVVAMGRTEAAKTGARIHCVGIGNGVSTELVQVR